VLLMTRRAEDFFAARARLATGIVCAFTEAFWIVGIARLKLQWRPPSRRVASNDLRMPESLAAREHATAASPASSSWHRT
jgi:hypothetical protein